MGYMYAMEYYSAIWRHKIGSFVEMWMNLASVIQSEICPKEKSKYEKNEYHMYLFYVIYAIFITYIILYLYNMYCYTFFFSLWRTSFCMTDSRFVHIYTNDPISDLFMVEYYSTAYMYHIFIHPSANGHLSCFYALLIVLMNSAAMIIEMNVSSWIKVFLEYMLSVEQGTGHKLGM